MDSFGFIITRHVNSEKTNKYWNQCVKCIRTLYPFRKIVIIDDNSIQELVKADYEYNNIQIIQSEFKGRGEFLPYYYYLKNNFFDNAVIIHDSVFLNVKIDFEKIIGIKVLPLWYFNPDKENVNNTMRIAACLRNSLGIRQKLNLENAVLNMDHNKWYGCFGVQSFINHGFLSFLEKKYKITNMINFIKCRSDRCCLERIFGCLFFTEYKKIVHQKSLFGNIMKYQNWGYTYDEYEKDFYFKNLQKPVLKVWTGR